MEISAKNLLFEEAAKYRDQLKSINAFVDKQSKTKQKTPFVPRLYLFLFCSAQFIWYPFFPKDENLGVLKSIRVQLRV